MTGEAWEILLTTMKFDGDYIQIRVPMLTACLLIHWLAKNIDSSDFRSYHSKEWGLLRQNLAGKKDQEGEEKDFHWCFSGTDRYFLFLKIFNRIAISRMLAWNHKCLKKASGLFRKFLRMEKCSVYS